MHICFLNPPGEYYSPISGGAISTIAMQVTRQLLGRGHRVSIMTSVNGDEKYSYGEIIPVTLPTRGELTIVQRGVSSLRRRLHHWDWPYYEYYRAAFSDKLAKLKPDAIILFNDLVSSRYLRPLLPWARIAVWLQNEWRTNQRTVRETALSTDVFLTCSDYIRRWTAEAHQIPYGRFAVAHSGVDLTEFTPRPAFLERRQTGAPLRVLFLGRIDFNKGPDIAADAVAKLRKCGVNVQLTVAGALWWYSNGDEAQDPFFRTLNAKMSAAGADYRGRISRPAVPSLVREHDVVCVLSRSNEPFALVTLEAMASGCAVIASNRGGLPESCGGAGILVDPDDFESVVQNLYQLASDPFRLSEQKRKSVERANRAPWSLCADRVEEALQAPNRSALHLQQAIRPLN